MPTFVSYPSKTAPKKSEAGENPSVNSPLWTPFSLAADFKGVYPEGRLREHNFEQGTAGWKASSTGYMDLACEKAWMKAPPAFKILDGSAAAAAHSPHPPPPKPGQDTETLLPLSVFFFSRYLCLFLLICHLHLVHKRTQRREWGESTLCTCILIFCPTRFWSWSWRKFSGWSVVVFVLLTENEMNVLADAVFLKTAALKIELNPAVGVLKWEALLKSFVDFMSRTTIYFHLASRRRQFLFEKSVFLDGIGTPVICNCKKFPVRHWLIFISMGNDHRKLLTK